MTESMRTKTEIVYSISGYCEIWADVDAVSVLQDFNGIEYIYKLGKHHFAAQLDPRYRWELLVEEIKEALEEELERQQERK